MIDTVFEYFFFSHIFLHQNKVLLFFNILSLFQKHATILNHFLGYLLVANLEVSLLLKLNYCTLIPILELYPFDTTCQRFMLISDIFLLLI